MAVMTNRETTYLMRKPRALPKLFVLKWNNAYARPDHPSRFTQHEALGAYFPNGRVSLDFGEPYHSLTALKEHVSSTGEYLIEWIEERSE
jgi:hypothetical protein